MTMARRRTCPYTTCTCEDAPDDCITGTAHAVQANDTRNMSSLAVVLWKADKNEVPGKWFQVGGTTPSTRDCRLDLR